MKTKFTLSSKAGMAFMIACFSAMVLITSCGKKNDPIPEPVGDLQIRAINTVSGETSQDLLVNGAVKATALAYSNASAYATISSGVSTIGFYNTGTTATMNAGGQVQLPIGAKVSVYYFKTGAGTPAATLYDDGTANPTAGKAKVRFLNINSFLDTTTPTPFSVSLDGAATALVPILEFAKISSFIEVEPGAKFVFKPVVGNPTPAFDGAIVAGKIYTIWVDGTSATNLTGHIILQN